MLSWMKLLKLLKQHEVLNILKNKQQKPLDGIVISTAVHLPGYENKLIDHTLRNILLPFSRLQDSAHIYKKKRNIGFR